MLGAEQHRSRSKVPELPASSALELSRPGLSFELVVNTLVGGVRIYRL